MTTATKTQFKGFYGYLDGRKVWVINEGTLKADKSPAYKVVVGRIAGYYGDHGAQADWSFAAAPIWVRKSEVSRTRRK